MKNSIDKYCMFLLVVIIFQITTSSNKIYCQDNVKHRVRLKADYFKEMNGANYIQIGAISKIEKQNVSVSNIELSVENEFYDEIIEWGSIKTNMKGECRFVIKDFNLLF